MRRLVGGIFVAVMLAAIASDAALFGIAVWKIALAVLGAGLFALAREPAPKN